MQVFLFILVGVLAVDAVLFKDSNCQISIDYTKGDLSEPQPLVLTDTEPPSFVLPKKHKLLIIPRNTSITLACPGKNNNFENIASSKSLKAVCLSGKEFLVDSETYQFNTFRCKYFPKEIVKKGNSPCLKVHQKYEIGFELESYFLKVYEVCRDESTYRTYYSKHTLVKEWQSYQYITEKPYWKYKSFYPSDEMNKKYSVKSQYQNLANLLGSDEQVHKYLYYKPKEWQWFHRGHLAPRIDFIYGSQQSTTFWLLNTNPQWGTFNTGNWLHLERNVRTYSKLHQLDLIVYTGVHGITTLTDVNDVEQPVYLHVNETTKMYPVPRFFWKIVHDPIGNRATAFVGLNEPYAKSITEDMYLCPDISENHDFSWLTWEPNNIKRGVSYVCKVEDLRQVVTTIPEIGETGVLV